MSNIRGKWAKVREFVQLQTGVSLRPDHHYRLEPTLGRIAIARGFGNALDFAVAASRADARPADRDQLIHALTVHETSFFRDADFWRAFKETVIPALETTFRGQEVLSVWCAGCANGQEAYTVAMLLEEVAPELAGRTRIFATDVSTPVIEHAERGTYSAFQMSRGVGALRLLRHFDDVSGRYQVKEKLRRRVLFWTYNLVYPGAARMPTGCSVVFCRNTMMYFNRAARSTSLQRLRGAVATGGWLGLGSTEILSTRHVVPGWYAEHDLPTAALSFNFEEHEDDHGSQCPGSP